MGLRLKAENDLPEKLKRFASQSAPSVADFSAGCPKIDARTPARTFCRAFDLEVRIKNPGGHHWWIYQRLRNPKS
jgi:hypothetical protein